MSGNVLNELKWVRMFRQWKRLGLCNVQSSSACATGTKSEAVCIYIYRWIDRVGYGKIPIDILGMYCFFLAAIVWSMKAYCCEPRHSHNTTYIPILRPGKKWPMKLEIPEVSISSTSYQGLSKYVRVCLGLMYPLSLTCRSKRLRGQENSLQVRLEMRCAYSTL